MLRVLSNTSLDLSWSRKAKLLSDMARRMQQSGYGIGFRVTALNGGIRAYLKCISNQQLKGTPLHRPRDWEGRRSRRNRDNWFQPTEENNVYSSVIFVPATLGSALVKMLQKQEERNV